MRTVFMGTPEFALSSLEALYESGSEVVLAVSQPDRPKGRGYVMTPSPVKQYALEHGTKVITPKTLKDPETVEILRNTDADYFIVTAYGKILTQEILDIPKYGCINIHASLLPKLRGAAPINRAVMNGDTVGGVTVMYMDAGMDTGDIILQKKTDIPLSMTAGEYHDTLMRLGKEALLEFLKTAESGNIPREKQDGSLSTYAQKITTEDALIDFSKPAETVYNQIRGLSPYPCAYCFCNGKRIKVKESSVSNGKGKAGTVISVDNGIEIACADKSIVINRLCCEGKGMCDAASFLRGHKIEIGTVING